MPHITYGMALEALKAAVEEKGDSFIYEKPEKAETCAYLHEDENGELTIPGCGVGNALLRLGVPRSFLEDYNEGYGVYAIIRFASGENVFTIDDNARYLLYTFQVAQDSEGTTWSEALEYALKNT